MAKKPKSIPPFDEALRREYASLWRAMTINPTRRAAIDKAAARIVDNMGRYKAVAAAVGPRVPWWLVGIIHGLESGYNFRTHLHNGDPLARRTVQVPAGRPKAEPAAGRGQPYGWEESATDALRIKGWDKIEAWPIERQAYELERFNGFGYRMHHPETKSPYLWSGTNAYVKGKYVKDGVWSPSAVSQQSGAMAILRALLDRAAIELDTTAPASPSAPAEPAPAPVDPSARLVSTLGEEETKRLQARLRELGYPEVGDIDGKPGRRTRGALLAWKADNALPRTDLIDAQTWVALDKALPRGVSPERAAATKEDLKAKGSKTITLADRLRKWSVWIGLGSAGAKGAEVLAPVDRAREAVDNLSSWHSVLTTFGSVVRGVGGFLVENWWIVGIVAALVGWHYGGRIIDEKLAAYRRGEVSK
jgi:lysozyme family protein